MHRLSFNGSSGDRTNHRRAEIVGWGYSVPARVLTNDDLARTVDTSDAWIRERTGIARRHVVSDGESTASLAIRASRAALQVADVNPQSIDLIIVGTSTPDHRMPATACQVQDALGATHAGAFDVNAACSGFVYGLTLGHQAIASGDHALVLVVGADALSTCVDWADRGTCILFGDGAGAVLLRAADDDAGVQATLLRSDGSGKELLYIPAGGSAVPISHAALDQRLNYLRMDGRQVYRFATHTMAEAIEQVAEKAGWSVDEIDCIIPHQANIRIINAAAKRLKLPLDRFVVNLHEYGNTSAASVPIALCDAIASDTLKPGSRVVLVGFGAGLTWAAAAVRWRVAAPEAPAPLYHRWGRSLIYGWAGLRSWSRRLWRQVVVLFIRKAERGRR